MACLHFPSLCRVFALRTPYAHTSTGKAIRTKFGRPVDMICYSLEYSLSAAHSRLICFTKTLSHMKYDFEI